MSILSKMPDGGMPFDPYFVPNDWSRLEYGRMLWKKKRSRERLLRHWTDPRHPYRERFRDRYAPLVIRILEANPANDFELDQQLQKEGHSLRTIMREIPPVIGSFY